MKNNTFLVIILALVIGALGSLGVAWVTGLNHHTSADLQSSPLFEQSRASAVSELEGETDPNNDSAPPQVVAPPGQDGPVVPQQSTMLGNPTCGYSCGYTCSGTCRATCGGTCIGLSCQYCAGEPDSSEQTSDKWIKWMWIAFGTLFFVMTLGVLYELYKFLSS
jgi:hypothetical protein